MAKHSTAEWAPIFFLAPVLPFVRSFVRSFIRSSGGGLISLENKQTSAPVHLARTRAATHTHTYTHTLTHNRDNTHTHKRKQLSHYQSAVQHPSAASQTINQNIPPQVVRRPSGYSLPRPRACARGRSSGPALSRSRAAAAAHARAFQIDSPLVDRR